MSGIFSKTFGMMKNMTGMTKSKVPTRKDAAEAKRKRAEELRNRKGRSASIVTGGAGITEGPELGRSSLLGSS